MDLVIQIGTIVTVVVVGLAATLRAVAPLTTWKGDDKAAGWLETLESFLTKIFVPAKHLKSGDKK